MFSLVIILFTSCKLLRIGAGRQEKTGCGVEGRNVGAEKLLAGNSKAIAAAKKAEKNKKGMQLQY